MGQEASKNLRSQLEHKTLEELLGDDKVIEDLEQHPIPQSLRENLARILASSSEVKAPSKGTKHRGKLAPLYSLRSEDIRDIPQAVQDSLRNFHQCKSLSSDDLLSLSSHYEYTRKFETALTHNRIVWRFLTTFYFDVVLELGQKIQRLSAQNVGIAFVVERICQVPKYDREVVRNNIQGWVRIGRRYRGLMNELGSGSLILFPRELSDSIWEDYLPVKGDRFEEATRFLRRLGLVSKCQEEGWNNLGDTIMRTVSGPSQFLFQQQLQIQWTTTSPTVLPGAGIPGIHGRPPILDSRTLAPSRVSKPIRKKMPKGRQTQRAHAATNHQDNCLLLPLLATNDQGWDPLGDILPNIANSNPVPYMHRLPAPHPGLIPLDSLPAVQEEIYQMDQGQSSRDTISDVLRLARPGTSTISALLNNDDNTFATATLTAQESLQDSADLDITEQQLSVDKVPVHGPTPPSLGAIQLETSNVQQLVVDRPAAILGDIWFGSLPGFSPFVSLRLSQEVAETIKPCGQKVLIRSPTADTN